MKTVNELKKLPSATMAIAISLDVKQNIRDREAELNTQYLERHPEVTKVPDFIMMMNEILALHHTLGCMEGLLSLAIRDTKVTGDELENAEKYIEK